MVEFCDFACQSRAAIVPARVCAYVLQVSLRYLLGSFYVNFSPLWPAVAELVTSHASNECKVVFWDVYTEVMEQVARNAGTYVRTGMKGRTSQYFAVVSLLNVLYICMYSTCFSHHSLFYITPPEMCSLPSAAAPPDKPASAEHISDLFSFHFAESQWANSDGRADHINCRRLLWKTLERFPEFAESRSKVLVPIFLRFVECEVTLWEEGLMQQQRIHQEDTGFPQGVNADQHGVTAEGVEVEGDMVESGEEVTAEDGGVEGMEEAGNEHALEDGEERMEGLKSSCSETVGKEARKARSTIRWAQLMCGTVKHLTCGASCACSVYTGCIRL